MVTRKIRIFLWTGSCEESKLVRIDWNRCCRPFAFGGLGLKDLALLNDSLLRKLTWKFITSNSFAFTFLRERYIMQLQKPQVATSPLPFGLLLGLTMLSLLRMVSGSLVKILRGIFGVITGLGCPLWISLAFLIL